MEETQFVLEVQIPEKTRTFLTKNAGNGTIADLVATYLREMAGGAVLVTRKDVGMIRESTNVRLTSGAQAKTLIEKAVSRKDGKLMLTWDPDPVYEGQLNELALSRGVDVKYLLQEFMDWTLGQGWQFEWNPEPVPLLVTPSDEAYLKKLIGTDPESRLRGTDLIRFVRDLLGDSDEKGKAA